MDYSIESLPLDQLETDCIIVGIYQHQQLTSSAKNVDQASHQLIHNLIERGDIKGKNGETLLVNVVPDSSISRLLLVGLGNKEQFNVKAYRKAITTAVKTLQTTHIKSAVCTLAEIDVKGHDYQWRCRQIVEIFDHNLYQFTHTKSQKPAPSALSTLKITATDEVKSQATTGLAQGLAIANGVSLTRYLADLAANICTPTFLAEKAIEVSKKYSKMSVDILEESDLERLKMHAFLAVSRGSVQPAKLICLNYQGANTQDKPIVLVGKGLTFDAGGISIKPSAGMDEMKYDMCGAASVLGTLTACAELDLPCNVIGIIPACENMPDGAASKPGDIVTSMSGQTIEVLNTDAEGRLILCDALTYCERFEPESVVDIATLTGACVVALGRHASGVMGNHHPLVHELLNAGKTSGDRAWELPLWDEYNDQLRSNFADIPNIADRTAGTITAACFLSRFTQKLHWAHMDIAGTAWVSGDKKGATGRPVPLLTQYLIDRCDDKK
ncbi:MAG: leucyl aminopeptidase [Methylococcales bacterium]|nr:leucyl aminopeptidase [Methylococcales bacterium]